jgi:hypothetical protein
MRYPFAHRRANGQDSNTTHFLGWLVAPVATGWVKDVTASFSWGLYLSALFSTLGGILIFFVRPAFRWGREPSVVENEWD